MSITGGLPRAIDRGLATGCEALQIFTKSSSQWRARPIPDAEIELFRTRVTETGIGPVMAHASYLINLASPDETLRKRSMTALADELYRAEVVPDAVPFQVLAWGVSEKTSDSFPVVWTPAVKKGRVLVITLGHDGDAHEHPAFRALLSSGVRWLEEAPH